MQGLVSQVATEPELARVYREQVVEPCREMLEPVIERGIARGDLRPDTDLRVVHELLLGPVFYRLLLSGGPLDRKLSTRLVDAILDGFGPARRAAANPRGRAGEAQACFFARISALCARSALVGSPVVGPSPPSRRLASWNAARADVTRGSASSRGRLHNATHRSTLDAWNPQTEFPACPGTCARCRERILLWR
jgi:hypothetical protein